MSAALLVLSFYLSPFSIVQAGDEQRYFDAFLQPSDKNDAAYYGEVVEKNEAGYHCRIFFMSGELKLDGWYTDEQLSVEHGTFTFYYQNGQVESKGEYRNGFKWGLWQRFEPNGQAKPEKIYRTGQTLRAVNEAVKVKKDLRFKASSGDH